MTFVDNLTRTAVDKWGISPTIADSTAIHINWIAKNHEVINIVVLIWIRVAVMWRTTQIYYFMEFN